MEKPLCISYIRFSSASQSDGSSLKRQLELSRKYADKHGLILDDKLRPDLAKSAFTGAHIKSGHFGRFLEAVKEGKIPNGSVLLVESLDRLSREDAVDAFNQLQTITNEGIKVITLCDNMEFTRETIRKNPSQLFMSFSIMIRANEESARKSERILAAFKFKRQNLSKIKFTGNCPTWLKLTPDKQNFEIISERAEIIKRIFTMSYDGAGIKTIARILNEEKIPPSRSSLGWCQSTIRKILSSCSVIGEYQPFTKNPDKEAKEKFIQACDPVSNYFPRIVEDDVYFAVQARLENGSHKGGRTAKVENLFGGITQCGYCGARMDVVTKHNRKEITRYLVCDQARRGVKCSYISFKCNELETAFLSYCREIDILDVLRLEGGQEQTKLSKFQQQLSAKNGELLRVDDQISSVDDDLLKITDPIEREHFRAILRKQLHIKAEIVNAIRVLNNQINEISSTINEAEARVSNILDLVRSLNDSADEDKRILFRTRLRNEFRQIVKQVQVYPRGNVASDEQIEKVRLQLETEIQESDQGTAEMLKCERDLVLAQMRKSQENTKEDRYFTVLFKNGNSRHIKYSKEDGSYKVTFDRIGNKIEWQLGGEAMKPIVLDGNDRDEYDFDEYFQDVSGQDVSAEPELNESTHQQ